MLDALEQALHDRKRSDDGSLMHHSDMGSQYLCIRGTQGDSGRRVVITQILKLDEGVVNR